MSKKLCSICRTRNRKRKCQLRQYELICVACCEDIRQLSCEGCKYYLEPDRLSFRCELCESRTVRSAPEVLAEHLHVSLFPVEKLDGPMSSNGIAVVGETYRTELMFPFESKMDVPFWLLVHRALEIQSIQLIRATIVNILNRDIYRASVEVLANDVVSIEQIPQVFPARDFDGDLSDPRSVFLDPLSIEAHGVHKVCRSFCQDGGTWAVFVETEDYPALIMFAQGWFCDWHYHGGHLRLDQDYYRLLLEDGEK